MDDRSQYFREFSLPFYGFNRPNAKVSQGLCDAFWLQCMLAGIKPVYDCIEQFSETDFSEDLRKFDVPTLIAHGDDDQIVPIGASALKAATLVPNAELKIYAGSPHGLAQTQHLEFNADLLAFIEGFSAQRAAPAAAPSGP
jgi:non-heme chloroperoxidase